MPGAERALSRDQRMARAATLYGKRARTVLPLFYARGLH